MRFETPVLFHPEAGVVDATKTIEACVHLAAKRGALVFEGQTVSSVIPGDDSALVVGGEQRLRARRVVLAVGAWAPEVLPGLLPFPVVRVTQQQIAHFPRQDASGPWPIFVHKDEVSVYGLPGGRDGGPGDGQKVAEHDGGRQTTATERDGVVEAVALARLVEYVKRWLPGLVPEPFNQTTCLYTTTADEDFVIERRGPLVVCSACSGHGAKFAPWLGQETVRLATSEHGAEARFRLERPGLVWAAPGAHGM